jgi:metal-sulfur cluster biosynthetic enzyme
MNSHERVIEQMRLELNSIIDPCSVTAGAPAGLVEMGLVREARVEVLEQGGFRAHVRICVTHPFCLMAAVFLNEVEKRLRTLPDLKELDVSMDSSTLWTPDLMSPEYRVRLDSVRKSRRLV